MTMHKVNSEHFLESNYDVTEGKMDHCSDEEIVSKIVDGRTELFAVITRRYNERLYRIIRGYLSNDNDIKDAMQSAYLNAYEGLPRFRGESRFSTWIIRIAINEALKKTEQQTPHLSYDSVTISRNRDQMSKEENETPETEAIRKDMNSHLEKAIDHLPPKYRSVLIMRMIEQMSTEETAETLQISRSNVKVRLHRAKKLLRNELEQMIERMDLFAFRGDDCEELTRAVMEKIQ